ncbi:MAG: class I SAM-dependent methyltransferase [Candidatus Thermoplasmatota archaeon]
MADPEYSGFFAEFYDILHSNLNDEEFYKNLADQYGPHILEIGSGTGRLLLPLAREGYEVTGLELNDDMLEICRKKMKDESKETLENIELIKGDMRDFKIDKNFELIIAPCNVICHILKRVDLRKALSCFKDHLAEEGVLIIDNSMPNVESMVKNNEEEKVLEFTHPRNGRKIVSSITPTYDFVKQIEKDTIVIKEFEGNKKTREAKVEEKLTFYFPRELRALLRSEGYEIFEERGSLNKEVPIEENSDEMIFLCRASN